MARRLTSPGRVRGFTLFELLVAVLVAAVLIAIIYAIYISASKTFRVQNMAMEMQAQARFGLEHLRRDFGNAGFLATPNSAIDQAICEQPITALKAITATRSPGSLIPNPAVNKNFKPLEFRLFGDYAGGGRVLFTKSVIGNTITLDPDFKLATSPTFVSQADFEDMFKADGSRYARLVDKDQYSIIRPISASSFDTGTITLSAPGIPTKDPGDVCGVSGFGEGLEVNSTHFIRYRLVRDTRANAPPNKTDLIREQLRNDGITPVQSSQLGIAEYVVDLGGYDFAFDTDATGLAPVLTFTPTNDLGAIVNDGGVGLLGATSTTSQDLRFVTLKITVRTASEDPELTHRQRTSLSGPIHTFDVEQGLEGASRTMTMTSKVMMTTLAVRNVKSIL